MAHKMTDISHIKEYFYYQPIVNPPDLPINLEDILLTVSYDTWRSKSQRYYIFNYYQDSNNIYSLVDMCNSFNIYYNISGNKDTNDNSCSLIIDVSYISYDISFAINRRETNMSQYEVGSFTQALSQYYGNYHEISGYGYYNEMSNNIITSFNNEKIKFGNIPCDDSYTYPENYTFFRLWKHTTTNNIIFYRAGKNSPISNIYNYELVFAKNCYIDETVQKSDLSYYIDFVCVQPKLTGELISNSFDFSFNFNNKSNKWYWSGNWDITLKEFSLNYTTDISQPFNMNEGTDNCYNNITQYSSVTISFDPALIYKQLPIQFTKWVDCISATSISCEGIRALSNMFNTEYTNCYQNDDSAYTDSHTGCTNYDNFPLLQHVDMSYLQTYLPDSSINNINPSIDITISNEWDMSFIQLKLSSRQEFRIYDWSDMSNVYNQYDTSQTILDDSGNTYLNFFELMKYFNTPSLLKDLSLIDQNDKNDKIIILYDTSINTLKSKNLNNDPLSDTSFITPQYNNFSKINDISTIPNFYNVSLYQSLQLNIYNRYAVAWGRMTSSDVSAILLGNDDNSIQLSYINADLSVANTTIIIQKDDTNPQSALMNWYDPSNRFNQQYYLKKQNVMGFSQLYWPGDLADLSIVSHCKPFEQSYYDNSYVREKIDNIFHSNTSIDISTMWSMQLFKSSQFSSTEISCITPHYNDISSLYLTNAKNHFFICQEISSKLYPLVVYASGSNLTDVMLYNHPKEKLADESTSKKPSYEWYNDGPDNSYSPFTKNNNLGTVFSWFFGADSSSQVKNILNHTLLDISYNQIASYTSGFSNDLSLVGLRDSSCDLSINHLANMETDCSDLIDYVTKLPKQIPYRFQYYKRYSERASMTISGLNNFMRYINPDIIHISGDCNDSTCRTYPSEDISNNHNLLYYTTVSNVSLENKDTSYSYFETAAWFQYNCAYYQDISKYLANAFDKSYNEIYQQTSTRTTWIYITPLHDNFSSPHTDNVQLTISNSNNSSIANSITIPTDYMFELDNSPRNIVVDDYYNHFDSIFNEYRTPKFLSKTIESNFISPAYSSNYTNEIYQSTYREFSNRDQYPTSYHSLYSSTEEILPTPPTPPPTPPSPSTPFYNFWGAANCGYSFSTTGVYTVENQKTIMSNAAIVIDGKYRENLMDEGIYNYIEKYTRTPGNAKDGLYCYNFKLDTNPMLIQPTGAMNTNKFSKIELEITTMTPPLNNTKNYQTLCAADGTPIGTTVQNNNTFKYNYDIIFMEERYNIVEFIGGNVGLAFSN